ncbi:hypothetical protein B0H16DRAFT_1319717 [Mycena metata]|uniref:Uncharacterized protein n=1 Tax=Mycena metata TaxID=1033252 RepID=A0AAD7IU25_9AGAR|nr:hypothetical protein B0H16DRAFT_1319717 [Mycena metata]
MTLCTRAHPDNRFLLGFRVRTDQEHRQKQQEYLKCKTAAARKAFVKEYAARYCELSRLLYFDLCRMIVIDPMHNLLLGLIKTHFYQIWVLHKVLRKTKEMRRFHALLAELRLPAFLGRLPGLMGIPAGGSLTADQWLVAAVIVCPILVSRIFVPQIWAEYMPDNHMDVDPEAEAMPDAGAVLNSDDDGEYQDADPSGSRRRQRRREDGDDSDKEEREARAPPNLHPDDPVNFCKLATSLYGESVIKPNHHYATHTAENVRDYGPLQEFWTFLFERINKVLKSYNSSNHSGGELETSFFREFHRTVQTSRIVGPSCVLVIPNNLTDLRSSRRQPIFRLAPRCTSPQNPCTGPRRMIGEPSKLSR